MGKKFRGIAILLGAALCAAAPGNAQEGRGGSNLGMGNRPIEITADRVSADSGRNSVTFEGSVVARQGDVTMYSNRLYAEYSKTAGAIERIEAEGNVRFIQAGREARAPKATFYNLEQRVLLSGGATLLEGENTLQGETLTIFLRENRSVVTGGDEGGRVKAVITPKGVMEPSPK
jgi:lipopolysaccharide export system protein LptA